ncbi:MAG: UDP-4-amino-4,6-dideoxy-N-acetyl-beta-L-altrosamine transaminase [Proteobacteria bacterium]|nr:UDP-4-amino-4,6-dideoxy-N-acetyl-beta-L-altrosamine transaminase [Pseudomonadota bacterium]
MKKIPYGKQVITEQDIEAVAAVLRSDWLTTGPAVAEFENVVKDFVGAAHGVAVSSGTAALHCAMYAIGVAPGDEVIVPAMTFAATANSVVYQGGVPIFADVDKDTLLLNVEHAESLITPRTKAIVAVDYAGQPCDYSALRTIADKHNLVLIADACHALGAESHGCRVGSLADITVFSFHPVKHITTGEGGMAVTDNIEYARRMRLFRNHGISTDFREREKQGSWHYEMVDLGFNYRMTDFQCALGISQMRSLPDFLDRRQEIAIQYAEAFKNNDDVFPLLLRPNNHHAWHLYVVKLAGRLADRKEVFQEMRAAGIGVNVHYIPVHLHPFYSHRFGYALGLCPVAEEVYRHILSLPIWPGMSNDDVDTVIKCLQQLANKPQQAAL